MTEKKKVILVTGAAGYWGSRLCAQLVLHEEFHVIGVDTKDPVEAIKGLDFIQADIRNPLMVDLLKSEQIYALVHLAFIESDHPAEAAFDSNVMGTMKIFAAAFQAGVEKIILRSTMAAYGARPGNSAFLSEDQPLRGPASCGTIRDLVEIESFCNGFRRQAPGTMLTVLRFPGIVGPSVDSPLTRYLKDPLSPTLLGFDPMMQVIHESDVIDAILYAALNDVPGVFNIAAEGVVSLDKMRAIVGKMPLPIFHLLAYWGYSAAGSRMRLIQNIPYGPDYIRFPWVGDLRRMRDEMGFIPRYTAEETLREMAGHLRVRAFRPEKTDLSYDEERLRDTIERRSRTSRQTTGSSGTSAGGVDQFATADAEDEDNE